MYPHQQNSTRELWGGRGTRSALSEGLVQYERMDDLRLDETGELSGGFGVSRRSGAVVCVRSYGPRSET